MVHVTVNTPNDLQRALRLFSRKVKDAGIIREIHDRREYKKPSVKKRLKRENALRQRIRDRNT